MAFDPDTYSQSDVRPVDPEELKRQQAAEASKGKSGGFDPDAYLASPVEQAPKQEIPTSAGDLAVGVPAAAAGFVGDHWKEIGGLSAVAGGAYKANRVANAYIKGKEAETGALNQRTATQADQASANRELQRQRMEERMARNAPPAEPVKPSPILDAQGRPMSPAQGPVAPEAPGARPGVTRLPSGTMPPQPAIGGPAAAEGSNFIENISKKYLPAAGRAIGSAMDTPIGRAVGTGARVLGSAPVMGAQLALTPGSTGPAVPSVGRLRGSEINPLSGRPWTPNEIAQYEQNYQMFDQQLPQPQLQR